MIWPKMTTAETYPGSKGENFVKNLGLVEEVKKLGSFKKASASQIALAWLLHQGNDIVPIPGTTKVKHLEENAKAADIRLDGEDLSKISRILSEIKISGDRYGEMMRKMVSAD